MEEIYIKIGEILLSILVTKSINYLKEKWKKYSKKWKKPYLNESK